VTRPLQYAGRGLYSAVHLSVLPALLDLESSTALHVNWLAKAPLVEERVPMWTHRWYNPDGSLSLQVEKCGTPAADGSTDYLLTIPGQCDFHLNPVAGTVAIDAHEDIAPNTLEHWLIDQALPRLLAQQGHSVAHASLVRIDTHTALFLGRSGWGKSTLAGLLHRRGHTALCDDCALLELRDGLVWATPAYPGIRLFEDSVEHAIDDSAVLAQVAAYSDKQRVIDLSLDRSLHGPQPLTAIYLLSDPTHASDAITIEPLTRAGACMALVEHSFRLDPTDHESTVQILRQASAYAHAVPAFTLCYPHDFTRKDDQIRLLLDHFRNLAGQTECAVSMSKVASHSRLTCGAVPAIK
jgi:hypothetical protein